jgi:hypothetical protein
VSKEEAFRRIELCVQAGRKAAKNIGSSPTAAELTIRKDVYVEETKSGVFRIRVWKHRIIERALLGGYDTAEAAKAIKQYEQFFNE